MSTGTKSINTPEKDAAYEVDCDIANSNEAAEKKGFNLPPLQGFLCSSDAIISCRNPAKEALSFFLVINNIQ